MKFQKCGRLMLAEAAALGWLFLRKIPFAGVLALLPLSLIFFLLPFHQKEFRWVGNILGLITILIASFVTAMGFGERSGWLSLLLLLLAIALFTPQIPEKEWGRISGWWGIAFLGFFVLLILGSLPGIQPIGAWPGFGKWWELLIFYLLAFADPIACGEEMRGAPLLLSGFLIPFAVISYSVLGNRGFEMAEYPYLSVLAGSTVISFNHLEAIILSLYYGLAVFKASKFGLFLRKELALRNVA